MGQGSRDDSLRNLLFRFALAVLLCLTIVGCATSPPAPIVDRTPSTEVGRRPSEVAPQPKTANIDVEVQKLKPAPQIVPPPQPTPAPQPPIPAVAGPANAATQQLLAAVDDDIERRNYDAATAGIERVLRIDPEDAWAWHKLAQLHFVQDDYVQAKSTALRSNALPSANARVAAANWFLIADIERASGDENAAQAAYAKAESKLNDERSGN